MPLDAQTTSSQTRTFWIPFSTFEQTVVRNGGEREEEQEEGRT